MTMKKCIYALDAGGSFLKSGLVDTDTMEVINGTRDSEAVNSASGTVPEIRAAYASIAARAKVNAETRGYEITAVGMDTPGPFEYSSGTFCMRHKYTALYGISVLQWFAEDIPCVPVHIIHDSSAFILGASRAVSPERRAHDTLGAVMIGTGLGFSLMRDGVPLTNEVGGPKVSIYRNHICGTEAEELISARGITNRYAALAGISGEHLDAKTVAIRARSGDGAAREVYAETGRLLGKLLQPILSEYDAHTLLLGGQISRDAELFTRELSAALRGVDVMPAVELDDAHLIGVAVSFSLTAGNNGGICK